MDRSRKQAHPNSEKKVVAPAPTNKPNTRAQTKEHVLPDSMADDTISKHSEEHLDIEQLLEDQILSPRTALVDLQQQIAVHTTFDAWINGLNSGKDARIHF